MQTVRRLPEAKNPKMNIIFYAIKFILPLVLLWIFHNYTQIPNAIIFFILLPSIIIISWWSSDRIYEETRKDLDKIISKISNEIFDLKDRANNSHERIDSIIEFFQEQNFKDKVRSLESNIENLEKRIRELEFESKNLQNNQLPRTVYQSGQNYPRIP
jgi:exonuclease VII small subunit